MTDIPQHHRPVGEKYPEHAKLRACQQAYATIETFMENFGVLSLRFSEWDPQDHQYKVAKRTNREILDEYFGIDRAAIDREREQMYEDFVAAAVPTEGENRG